MSELRKILEELYPKRSKERPQCTCGTLDHDHDCVRKEYIDKAEADIRKLIPSVQQMSEVTGKIVEECFPKGKCAERGMALVLHAQMLIAIHELIEKRMG